MYKHFAAKSLISVAAVFLVVLGNCRPSAAASVKFTAGVPNGTTQFQNIVQFSVANQSNSFSSDQLEIGAGATGNGIATTMETDLENFSSFEGDVAGNMLTVPMASTGAYLAGAEVDMSMEIDNMGDGCAGCDLPDFPVTIGPRHTHGSLVVLLVGPDGMPAPVQSTGAINMTIAFPDVASTPFTFNASFTPGMTTTDILQLIDTAFDNTTWPTGVEYFGLENGFPSIGPGEIELLSFSLGVTHSGVDPGFLVGAAAIGAIPEPTTLPLTCLAMLAILRVRVRSDAR